MRKIYILLIGLFLLLKHLNAQSIELPFAGLAANADTELTYEARMAAPSIRTPWRAQRMNYFKWWGKDVFWRITEQFKLGPKARFCQQNARLSYVAEETLFGGEIRIDDDLLNAVNFPSVVENRLDDIVIELPEGKLSRSVKTWTSMSSIELEALGWTLRGTYWSGALAPARFPQPGDIKTLFNAEELVDVAAREIAATSAFNNAVSLEIMMHPIHFLTGFRALEWTSESGFYVGGDFLIGWVKTTDLTFRQGRELLGDIDMGEEIRNVLPNPIENLIDTDEAGDLLLTALESRLPLYGFGLPVGDGRSMELLGWMGYQWQNKRWSGDMRIGLVYQRQRIDNEHAAAPELVVSRWAPTIRVKWVFNKKKNQSSLF